MCEDSVNPASVGASQGFVNRRGAHGPRMTHGSGPADPTLAAIEALHGTVLMARALVSTGRPVDLAGLDTEPAASAPRWRGCRRLGPAAAAGAAKPCAREVDGLPRCCRRRPDEPHIPSQRWQDAA